MSDARPEPGLTFTLLLSIGTVQNNPIWRGPLRLHTSIFCVRAQRRLKSLDDFGSPILSRRGYPRLRETGYNPPACLYFDTFS
jgi:hypothetical protein